MLNPIEKFKVAILHLNTVYAKRNAHLILIFFVASLGEGGQKCTIFVLKHASTPFKIFSKRLQIFQRKKLSMYRIPIYIIDHVNFWFRIYRKGAFTKSLFSPSAHHNFALPEWLAVFCRS